MWYEVNTILLWKKQSRVFKDNTIINDYVYFLNGKDETIEMSRYNIEVEN